MKKIIVVNPFFQSGDNIIKNNYFDIVFLHEKPSFTENDYAILTFKQKVDNVVIILNNIPFYTNNFELEYFDNKNSRERFIDDRNLISCDNDNFDILFVSESFVFQLFYNNKIKGGKSLQRNLNGLFCDNLNNSWKYKNNYTSLKLENTIIKTIKPKIRYYTSTGQVFYVSNNSIIKVDNVSNSFCNSDVVKYVMNLRHVNFIHDKGTNYRTLEVQNFVKTWNVIATLDKDFNIIDEYPLLDLINLGYYIRGIEDLRLFIYKGRIFGFGSSQEYHKEYEQKIVLVKLPMNFLFIDNEKKLIPEFVAPISTNQKCEKNWLGFEANDKIEILYSPRIKGSIQGLDFIQTNILSENLKHLRGSGGPIEWNDGYLVLTHEVLFNTIQPRIYLHRFVYYTKDLTPLLSSKAFYINTLGVEYVTGFVKYSDDSVVISYSVDDRESFLCICDNVNSLLIIAVD